MSDLHQKILPAPAKWQAIAWIATDKKGTNEVALCYAMKRDAIAPKGPYEAKGLNKSAVGGCLTLSSQIPTKNVYLVNSACTPILV